MTFLYHPLLFQPGRPRSVNWKADQETDGVPALIEAHGSCFLSSAVVERPAEMERRLEKGSVLGETHGVGHGARDVWWET